MATILRDRAENIMGEGENTGINQHFLVYPKCFQKLSFSGSFNPFPHNDTFDSPGNKPFENTVGKGETARYEQFLLFPQYFLPVWITFCHFCQI